MESCSCHVGSLQLESAIPSARALICLIDHEGRLLRANDTLRRWGCGEIGQVRGQDLHRVLHADCMVENCYLRHFCEQGKAEIAKGRRIECGAFDPVLNRFINIKGEPTGFRSEPGGAAIDPAEFLAMLVLDDVTEASLAEERVSSLNRELSKQVMREAQKRKQEEAIHLRMQVIIECTSNFVAMSDAHGRLTYLNPAGREMLGIDLALDVSAMTVLDLHTKAAGEAVLRQAFPAASESGNWIGRSVLCRRDGSEIETSQVVIAHYGVNGQHEGFSIVEHDMTAWLLGEQALRESHAELARLSEQLISIQETERRRIAADIHDGIGQSLSLIKMRVSVAAAQLENGATAEVQAALKGLMPLVQDTIDEVRRVATDLRPSSLEDLGILATLAWFCREVEATCQGIRVDREITANESDIHPELRIVIFRIIQEAVSNIVKHAMPRRIRVVLRRYSDHLMLGIEDDGCGFDPADVVGIDCTGRGFGLSSMKERARLSGGRYELRSARGQGTRIQVEWPIPASA